MSEGTLYNKTFESKFVRTAVAVASFGTSELVRYGYNKSKEPGKARDAQNLLEERRRAELTAQSAARASARKRAETAGQRAGRGGPSSRSQFTGGADIGMGTANSNGSGRGRLFGN